VHYRLIIPPEMSQAIGNFGLGRLALLKVLNTVYRELEDHAANHRQRRDHARPDLYFYFELAVVDHEHLRGYRFTVDDVKAPDRLFLVAVEEI
jgi:hypothetical protein